MPSLESIRFAQEVDSAAAPSPEEAARCAHDRADAIARGLPERVLWACRKGCTACCHLLVEVKPEEAASIAAWARDAVDAAAFEDLRRRLADRAARAEGLTAGAYRQARIPCAFLEESGECRIYERRPVKCRVHVSMSETACQETEGPLPLHQWLTWVGRAIHRGMSGDPLRELHGAVLAALNGDA